MAKVRIKGQRGKQLYLNRLFIRGMLYTTSEMTEGFARIINNYDISPTGDSATPRFPFAVAKAVVSEYPTIIPVNFSQDVDNMYYISFKHTISENAFRKDEVTTLPQGSSIEIKSRSKVAMKNEGAIDDPALLSESMSYETYDEEELEPEEGEIYNTYRQGVIENAGVNVPTYPNDITFKNQRHEFGEIINEFLPIRNNLIDLYLPGTYESYNPNLVRIIDGDTIEYSNQVYRLAGVNTPEINPKQRWGDYAKTVVSNILNDPQIKFISFEKPGPTVDLDPYQRKIRNIFLIYDDPSDHQVGRAVSLSLLLLRTGLANPFYEDTYTQYNINLIISENNIAIGASRKLYSANTEDFDPFYKESGDYSWKSDDFKMKSTYTLEIVKIQEEYRVSQKVWSKIDQPSYVYVDYLDAIAFIGRIRDADGSILYKGMVMLQCGWSDDTQRFIFRVYAPNNNFQGEEPDLFTAATNGYNLTNNELLHFDNIDKPNQPFYVAGIAVANDNNEIVEEGALGYPVDLKAILNESGYYYHKSITTTDRFEWRVRVRIKETEGFYYRTHTGLFTLGTYADPLGEVHLTGLATPGASYTTKYYTSTTNVLEPVFDLYDQNLRKITGHTITSFSQLTLSVANSLGARYAEGTLIAKFNSRIIGGPEALRILLTRTHDIDSIAPRQTKELIFDNATTGAFPETRLEIYEVFLKLPNRSELKVSGIISLSNLTSSTPLIYNIVKDSVFDLWIRISVTNTASPWQLNIELFDNLNNLNNKYTQVGNSLELVPRTISQNPNLEFFRVWEIATPDSDDWEDIGDGELKVYTLIAGTSNLVPVSENNVNLEDWYINQYKDFAIRFRLIPKVNAKLGPLCPTTLESVYIANYFQEMSVVYPRFRVSNIPKLISTATLTRNIYFKNATRIGIFNRQLFLYGPYTGANFIAFSNFENEWYFSFPFGLIELDEPVVAVKNYADSLVVFGQYNIQMLTGGESIRDCTKYMVYENLSSHVADYNLIHPVGGYLMFFNQGMGYIIVPNVYVNDPTKIKIYKLTESVNNFLHNPENFLRVILKINYEEDITDIRVQSNSFVRNNEVVLILNYTVNNNKKLSVFLIYNQDYRYWRLYSIPVFERAVAPYICEPEFNNQFIVEKDGLFYLSFQKITAENYRDIGLVEQVPITALFDSGYLGVDTLNDKRFKDLLFSFDNVQKGATLSIGCNYFIDGSPITIADLSAVVIDEFENELELEGIKVFDGLKDFKLEHIAYYDEEDESAQPYGVRFEIDNKVHTISGRCQLRVPIWGKGRLPSFILTINSDKFYEFKNFSLVYKEKSINRRR